jgi:hypothetical protein
MRSVIAGSPRWRAPGLYRLFRSPALVVKPAIRTTIGIGRGMHASATVSCLTHGVISNAAAARRFLRPDQVAGLRPVPTRHAVLVQPQLSRWCRGPLGTVAGGARVLILPHTMKCVPRGLARTPRVSFGRATRGKRARRAPRPATGAASSGDPDRRGRARTTSRLRMPWPWSAASSGPPRLSGCPPRPLTR